MTATATATTTTATARDDARHRITGCGLPLIGNDIDTDRILPARYLKSLTFEGLGANVFADDRRLDPAHPFNQPKYGDASILVVAGNFGCGSSREHAPEALRRWGIRAIVGVSFGEIFAGNCTAIGVPCATAEAAEIDWLQALIEAEPKRPLALDLERCELHSADRVVALTMPEAARSQLLDGTWNATGVLLEPLDLIRQLARTLPYMTGYR